MFKQNGAVLEWRSFVQALSVYIHNTQLDSEVGSKQSESLMIGVDPDVETCMYQIFFKYWTVCNKVRFENLLGKVKVNLTLCLIKYHAMRPYGRVVIRRHAFLTSALDGSMLERIILK
jgi:hypothetical protein